jgi:molecular chaperone HscB
MTSSSDPFALLGVEPRFDLDDEALAERHRDLSRALHPDRYASAPAAERRLALGKAIEVNEAYRTLRDPVKRAEAVAKLAGLAVGEDREPKASPALLMEMMEAREELSEASRAKDLGRVESLGAGMRAREKAVVASISEAFAKGDTARVLPLLGELRYVRRFLDEVAAFEETLLS